MIQDEIESLENQLVTLKTRQLRCLHEWSEPKYTPYQKKEEHIVHG